MKSKLQSGSVGSQARKIYDVELSHAALNRTTTELNSESVIKRLIKIKIPEYEINQYTCNTKVKEKNPKIKHYLDPNENEDTAIPDDKCM